MTSHRSINRDRRARGGCGGGQAGRGRGHLLEAGRPLVRQATRGRREAVVTINASGATLSDAKADLRAKAEQHLRGGRATIDASATLARYLQWWVEEELAERVAEGMIVSTTRQQCELSSRLRRRPAGGAYVLALHIPLRVGEFVGAEWSCFDLERRLFSVRQNLVRLEGRWELHGTKTHKVRVVPLPDAAVVALPTSSSRTRINTPHPPRRPRFLRDVGRSGRVRSGQLVVYSSST